MTLNPITAYKAWRNRYTPKAAERYVQIAEYDWWSSIILNDLIALTPTLITIAGIAKGLELIASPNIKIERTLHDSQD